MAAREAELLPAPYFHIVFTLPAAIADIAYQNKAVIYDLLFKASSETMLRIAADPKHLGARIGITAVLHTWGSAMTHHPHVHMIVPGGGLAFDGSRWIAAKPRLPPARARAVETVPAVDAGEACGGAAAGQLQFFGRHAHLANTEVFTTFLAPFRKTRWFVYAKCPFAGPKAVLAYLSRYTHRVASIPNIGFMSKSFLARDPRPGTLLSGLLAGRRGRHHISYGFGLASSQGRPDGGCNRTRSAGGGRRTCADVAAG